MKDAEARYLKKMGKNKKKSPTPEKQLIPKDLEELCNGAMKHPALALLADEKARKRIIFGDIKRPTEYDKDIVQESDDTGVFEKSRFAYLAKELAYIGRHLERLNEEKVEGEIAEWYKRAECAFTHRLIPIQAIYKDIEGALAGRLPNLRGDFRTGYRKLLAVARQSDKDRVRCFGFLPVKPIADFKLAAKEFYETIYAIHTEAHLALDKLKQAGQASGEAGDEIKTKEEKGQKNEKIFGDKISIRGLEINWRIALAKFKKLMSRVKTVLHKQK